MQPKQIVSAVIAIGLPLAAVWMMMQPPGGAPPTPATPINTSKAAPKPTQPVATTKPTGTSVVEAPVPVPQGHAKATLSPVRAKQAAVGQESALFFTANGLGEYDDCGCKKRPLGGVARRVQWMADRVKEKGYKHWISASAGGLLTADAAGPIPPPAELKSLADAFFSTFKMMNYVAMNVGIQDLPIGPKALREAAAKHGLSLVSANLVGSDGKPVFGDHVVVKLGEINVGFFGLLSQDPPNKKRWVVDQGLQIQAVVATAKAQVAALRAKGCQLIVALAQLSDEEKDDVGEKVPGVDLVLATCGASRATTTTSAASSA